MSEPVGDFLYSNPSELNGNVWSGRIVATGYKVDKFTTYRKCDFITYNNDDIVETLTYEGNQVHKLWCQNIVKIEGVY